jgi:uncharacterized protein (TIGR03083 family)
MDALPYASIVAAEGSALADAAQGHLDRPVPGCPDWNVAQLVSHLGGVYAWAEYAVEASGERVSRRDVPAPPAPGDSAELLPWFQTRLEDLLDALSADSDAPAWTFPPSAPNTVGWWQRRQALETVVHRWDVQTAADTGRVDPIAADLAAEGVDEFLADFLPRALAADPADRSLSGTLHLHATDTPGEWWLDFDAEKLIPERQHAKADTAVRGPAAGLYLWLWNRQTPEAAGLEVFGQVETAAAWPDAVKL